MSQKSSLPQAPKSVSQALIPDIEEFDQGFTYKRIREGQNETSQLWTVGRVALWPNGFYLGDHFEWRVPVDNCNSLSVSWFHTPLPIESDDYKQAEIPAWRAPIYDAHGRWLTSHILNQDIVGWVGQGIISDRTKEHLGASDRGIAMMRLRYMEEIEKIQRGEDPKGTIRDPEAAKCVPLPAPDAGPIGKNKKMPRAEYVKDKWFAQRLKDLPWHAGYPSEILQQYRKAVGVE